MAKSRSKGKIETVSYDWEKHYWPRTAPVASSTGLVVYARVDGTFAVWDPERSKIRPPAGASRSESPLIFDKSEINNGIKEGGRDLCSGLIADWIKWQSKTVSPFGVFTKILHELSTCSQEPLKPGEPVRIPGDTREIPSLIYPYSIVPLVHAASSVQRIISLAYLILWTWEEHKLACEKSRKAAFKNMIVLIDEIESHLHPQWQRSIIPALLEVKKYLDDELDVQFFITTHSPLIMASIEPVFEEENDSLFYLGIDNNEVVLKEQPFLHHGRVDNWFTSDTFGLHQARSLEAEKAIEDAKNLQQKDNPTKEEVREVHRRLTGLLGDFDTFWPRWAFFAKQHGVDL